MVYDDDGDDDGASVLLNKIKLSALNKFVKICETLFTLFVVFNVNPGHTPTSTMVFEVTFHHYFVSVFTGKQQMH